ncbi:MAG: hypothetical protein Ct9H300mP19_04490 [Dehalococcoidia bacterium]|nr:MAG: hypothetical protein Ct9H300mP19_04490 [Dehalococcoidia bacterium]
MLGSEQSGQISAIGFDLYTKLLSEAVRQLKELEGGQDVLHLPYLNFPLFGLILESMLEFR